jgi:hypothetical protein
MEVDGYRSGQTTGGKCGCAAAALVGVPLIGLFMFGLVAGDCMQGDPCHAHDGPVLLFGFAVIAAMLLGLGLGVRAATNAAVRRWRR